MSLGTAATYELIVEELLYLVSRDTEPVILIPELKLFCDFAEKAKVIQDVGGHDC